MTIPVWDYRPELEEERAEIHDAVDTVLDSGRLVLGASLQAFEREFADYHGAGHCVGVDNGTNALVLALRALGVGPGDEVITVAHTAVPTVIAIDAVGARPVLVDVREDHLIDPGQVAAAVTERTRVVLPVHLYGRCADMTALRRIADEHGLRIVEDCAQATGARHDGRLAGTLGDLAAFSFYPTKVLGGFGDGGAVLTGDAGLAEEIRSLRFYGMKERYYTLRTPAYNSRLDDLHAEILRRRLRRLDGYLARRRAVAARYAEGLADTGLVLPDRGADDEHAYHLYVVRHPDRDRIVEAVRAEGVGVGIHYPWPVHTMTGFAHLGYAAGSLPVTERLSREVFSLPMYPTLTTDQQDRVIEVLRKVVSAG
ncbi:DegT/DnrJ/EryC1/StrS family aminotransferase [Marinactinospora thermotolerans]|uniref:DegT/DnrJ/EryC1/StrS family aminotransferase n=1 Tax=Marinactinospora thermotolerans TaxID=531310 RepID=UPI003D8C548F